MIKGMDPKQRVEFVSKYDDGETKTIFVLRPLTGEERNNMNDGTGEVKLAGTKLFDFLEMSIVEIKNFEVEGTIREKLNSIQNEGVLIELIEAAGKLSNMTRQDQKN